MMDERTSTQSIVPNTTKLRWVTAFAIWSVSMASFIAWAVAVGMESNAVGWSFLGLTALLIVGSPIVPPPPKIDRKPSWRWYIPSITVAIIALIVLAAVAVLTGSGATAIFTMGLTMSLSTAFFAVRHNVFYNWLR